MAVAGIDLGGDWFWVGKQSTMEMIFEYAAAHVAEVAPNGSGLAQRLTSEARIQMDSNCGWYIKDLSLVDYELLEQLMLRLNLASPDIGIPRWKPESWWLFYKEFAEFRAILRGRMAQLHGADLRYLEDLSR